MEIEFYETSSGRSPVAEFMINQSAKMRAKILSEIEYLEKMGINLRMPYSEKISGEIFRLRAQAEGEKARVLYFFCGKQQGGINKRIYPKDKKDAAERNRNCGKISARLFEKAR